MLLRDRLDDGGSKYLWNVGQFLPDYTASQNIVIFWWEHHEKKIYRTIILKLAPRCEQGIVWRSSVNSVKDLCFESWEVFAGRVS
jgi:hypothetical protein